MGEDLAATRVLVATVLVNLGLAGAVGAWASALWMRKARSRWAAAARRRSWSRLRLALGLTLLFDGLQLWLQAAYMGDLPLAPALAALLPMLRTTYVGRAGAASAAGLALALAAVGRATAAPRSARLAVVICGVGLFVYGRAAVSHAGDFGLASPQLLVECLHLSAMSLWLGGVGIGAFAVLNDDSAMTVAERSDAAGWVRSLSAVATGALMVVAGTGLFNAWRSVGSPARLVGNPYGNALLVKVALVAVAVALGGFNRFRVMPRLLTALRAPLGLPARPRRRFVRILRIEAFVLLAALVAAAVLGSSPLPGVT